MDKQAEVISPEMGGSWQSPLTDTPKGDGSSRQDSGYSSSGTPHSRSLSPLLPPRFCQQCRKPAVTSLRHQSTPVCTVCTCRTKGQSPFECLTTIREGEVTPFRAKRVLPLSLEDDSMDASLYPELDPDSQLPASSSYLSGETKQWPSNDCEVNTMDISDEASIDFVDKMLALPSSSVVEDKMDVETELVPGEIASMKPPVVLPVKRTPPTKPKENKPMNLAQMIERVRMYNYVLHSFRSAAKPMCMRGIEQVDFLFQMSLNGRDFKHIIELVFSFLSEKDLNNVSLVSKTWKGCVEKDRIAFERLNLYKTKLMLRKENYSSPTKRSGGSGGGRVLGVLQAITNLQQGSAGRLRSPPLSPASARHKHARQVASTVKKGDRVLKCPRCEFVVPDHGRSPTAQCRRSGCRHQFCVYCRGEVNGPRRAHDCPPLLTPRSATRSANKMHLVGSKDSKRNLKRTLI